MESTVLHPHIAAAYRVLETGEPILHAEALLLADLPGELALDLAALANKVKNRYGSGPEALHTCSIMNAKSGVCGENCAFAPSQSTIGRTLKSMIWLMKSRCLLRHGTVSPQGFPILEL